ncbi:hypothetical protein ScPMuIL_002385, partial [Solemya velum]
IARNFLKEPSVPQYAFVGGVARFQCEIRAVPQPLYVWEKDHIPIPQNDNRYRRSSTGILQIINVTLGDIGQYRCIAAQGALHELPDEVDDIQMKSSTEASLIVKPDTGNRPPQIIAGPGNVTSEEGSTVILECLADGNPLPAISWRRQDGVHIREERVVRESGYLKLLDLEPSDEAIYICTATSSTYDPVQMRGQITVKTYPRLEEEPMSTQYPMARLVRFPCQASGKPRPEIRWLKDGIPVNNEGRIMFRKNVLIITQSVQTDSGYYQCIAENSVGYTMSTTRLKVFSTDHAPNPPTIIEADALSSTVVKVNWSPAEAKKCCPTLAYTVHYEDGDKSDNKVVIGSSFELDELTPYTNYSIYLRAYSKQGASGNSETVLVQTKQDVPSAAPLIRLYSESPMTITVEWEELSRKRCNGIIVGYKIFYMEDGQATAKTINVRGSTHKHTIIGLKPNTLYKVRVLAGTVIGYPEFSEKDWPWMEYLTTGAILPSPLKMQIASVNATSVNIIWDDSMDSTATVYTITIRKVSDKKSNTTQILAPASKFTATNLENNTLYEVSLVANNEHGPSVPVIEEFQTSNTPVPPPPREVHATLHTADSINLAWQQPNFTKEIVYYMVRYREMKTDGNSDALMEYKRSDTLDLLVEELNPYTYYEFAVRAHSRHTIGLFSKPIIELTREAKPSAPLEPDVRVVSPGSVEVLWKPPAQPNGNVTSYIIMYSDIEGHWLTLKREGTATAVVIQNLEGIHYFKLRACNGAGESPDSQVITMQILGPPLGTKKTEEPPDQKLGIIVGVTVGIVCVIICVLIIVFRRRCLSFGQSPVPSYSGNGHIPGQNRTFMGPVITQVNELHELEPYTPMLTPLPENEQSDAKGGGGGNMIVTPNGTRCNGYVPIRNGKKMDYLSNGHVTTFIGRHYDMENTYPSETSGLIAAMLAGNSGMHEPTISEDSILAKEDHTPTMDSLEDIDRSGEEVDSTSRNHVLPQSTFQSPTVKKHEDGNLGQSNKGSLGLVETTPIPEGQQNGLDPPGIKRERQLTEGNFSTSNLPSPNLRIQSSQTIHLPTSTQNSIISSVRESPHICVGEEKQQGQGCVNTVPPMSRNSLQGRDSLHHTAQGDCSFPQREKHVFSNTSQPLDSGEVRFAPSPQESSRGAPSKWRQEINGKTEANHCF